jgi:hypothetical protein
MMVVISLELQHHIDDMLEHLRPCQSALLVDMADQQHRDGRFLGIPAAAACTFPYLEILPAGESMHRSEGSGPNQ